MVAGTEKLKRGKNRERTRGHLLAFFSLKSIIYMGYHPKLALPSIMLDDSLLTPEITQLVYIVFRDHWSPFCLEVCLGHDACQNS